MKELTLDFGPATSGLTADEVYRDLVAEFHRLNATYFDNGLKMPAIILSRRKSFGGYYQPARHRIVLSWQAYEEYGWDETLKPSATRSPTSSTSTTPAPSGNLPIYSGPPSAMRRGP